MTTSSIFLSFKELNKLVIGNLLFADIGLHNILKSDHDEKGDDKRPNIES